MKKRYFISGNGLSVTVDNIRKEDIILWLERDREVIGSFWLTDYKLKHHFTNDRTIFMDIVKK
jgi:hypothetical protein